MRRSYHDREADYRRRLRIVTPIAAALIFLLFFSQRNVSYEVLEQRFGWEGPTQILPEITIVPDTDPFEDLREESRRRRTEAVLVEEWEDTGPAEGAERRKVSRDADTEKEDTPELDEEIVRHYPSHTAVPYSEEYVILHMVKPEYPPEELKRGIEGDVTVEILVNDSGTVERAWVLAATGSRNFETASLEAVRQFRFRPAIVNGAPTEMWIRFQIRFRIIG